MLFDNAYYLSDPLEQLRAQKLNSNVFFGPLNTLTQSEFIKEHNIRLFIGVGLDTQRLATILSSINTFSYPSEEFLLINFDPGFNHATLLTPAVSDVTKQYCSHNSSLLRSLIDHFTRQDFDGNGSNHSYRCLTPTPERPDSTQQVDCHIEQYYKSDNVFTDTTLAKFQAFNDLITIFKHVNPAANVLVFSQNGNDLDLVTFLISFILKKNPRAKVIEAYQFIKSVRPTIDVLSEEDLYGCNALVDYQEFVSARGEHIAYSAGLNSPTPQPLRKRTAAGERGTAETVQMRSFGFKRNRFD